MDGDQLELDFGLKRMLDECAISVRVQDSNTIHLLNVPVNAKYFSKDRTNVLIKKMPFMICLDEDLEYRGSDIVLIRAFAGSSRHKGWRVLLMGQQAQDSTSGLVRRALRILGSEDTAPTVPQRAAGHAPDEKPASLIEKYGTDLGDLIFSGGSHLCIGRAEFLEEVRYTFMQSQSSLLVISGGSGVGKTNLLHALAGRLLELPSPLDVCAVNLGLIMAGSLFDGERERLLASLLEEVLDTSDMVLALEEIEQGLSGVPRGALLIADALDKGARLIGTSLRADLSWFRKPPLVRRMRLLELPEMGPRETLEVLAARCEDYVERYKIGIAGSLLPEVVQRAVSLEGLFPAKAIALLESAVVRATAAGAKDLAIEHIYLAATGFFDTGGEG